MPELPPEIFDAIIDEIWTSSCAEKSSTLLACSRSTRRFLYRVRAHLFREVHLYHPSCMPLPQAVGSGLHCLLSHFHDVLIHSSIPLDAGVVRSLHLHGNPDGTDREEWLQSDHRLSEVLAALQRLERLSFGSLKLFAGVPSAPSVTHIVFHKVSFTDAGGLAQCLGQFPSMESLSISTCSFQHLFSNDLEPAVDFSSLRALALTDMCNYALVYLNFLCLSPLQSIDYQSSAVQWLPKDSAALFYISRLLRVSKSVTDLNVNMCSLSIDWWNKPPLLSLSNLTSLSVTFFMHGINDFLYNTETIQFDDARLVTFLLSSLSQKAIYSLETFTLSLDRVWYPPHFREDHSGLLARIGSSLASSAMPYLARVRVVHSDTGRPVWLCSRSFGDVKETAGFAALERRDVLDMAEPAEWEKRKSPWCMG